MIAITLGVGMPGKMLVVFCAKVYTSLGQCLKRDRVDPQLCLLFSGSGTGMVKLAPR
jgi:hypothetical protein